MSILQGAATSRARGPAPAAALLATPPSPRGAPAAEQQQQQQAAPPLSPSQLQAQIQRQVVQLRTLHMLASPCRPWEKPTPAQSYSTAFVLDPQRRLLMTTAGAVEAARRVLVSRSSDALGGGGGSGGGGGAAGSAGEEVPARVLAVCLDADVAVLQVGAPLAAAEEEEEEDGSGDSEGDDSLPRAAGSAGAGAAAATGSGAPSRKAAAGAGGGLGRARPRASQQPRKEERFWRGLQGVRWGPLPGLQVSGCAPQTHHQAIVPGHAAAA